MIFCPKCGEKIEEGSVFCQSCGASIETKMTAGDMPKKGLMGKIEQTIYFRIARVFAWLVAALATIGFIVSVKYTADAIPQVLAGSVKVSQEKVLIYLGIWAGIMLAMIFTITITSMILVTLAIERNTRKVE
jgi:hypothetical protein